MALTLLQQFKLSIGDFNETSSLDTYYQNLLDIAKADLLTDDISETNLNGELGQACQILYAEALMKKEDIASNATITLLRNKLATMTKGDAYLASLAEVS